ncbi:C2 family cysteine protease [Psychromicrobium xiongbiense]|uniref:C2 family cysteine protease n=1 Tax=Psychromicrobium xiongbiense TaxID=3051184 RepID=UPI002552DA32|nr:C2 family cysteine protease [Psychromicrobium sp. YIM S02556]
MSDFLGANPQDLRDFAHTAQTSSEQISTAITTLSSVLTTARWHGPDAAQFRSVWTSRHVTQLSQASTGLLSVATILQRNAEEQEKASAVDGGGNTTPRSGGNSDRPGNPGLPDGMGKYKPLPDTIPTDAQALSPTNIKQGQVGDCWFLAGAAAVAAKDPQWIRDHLWRNPDGTWTVKMYKDGNPVYIQVEPTVPEQGAKDASGHDNWLSIYEKAAAEYWGGNYKDLDGGYGDEAFQAITGKTTHRDGELNFDKIQEKLTRGPVTAGTERDPDEFHWFWEDTTDDPHIVPGHEYIVDTITDHVNPQTGKNERMIHLLNPWGPNGGQLNQKDIDTGNQRWGDVWLTEQQYKDNFSEISSMDK